MPKLTTKRKQPKYLGMGVTGAGGALSLADIPEINAKLIATYT